MSQYFRFEIDQPASKTQQAKSWIWTPDSEVVESAEISLSKEGKRISSLNLTLWDSKDNGKYWPLANALPDPAFLDVPVRAFLSNPAENQAASKLVFDGKMTSLQPAWPGPSMLSIVAHDRSFDLRIASKYRTIMRKTSVQLAQAIASEYGYTVDTSDLAAIDLSGLTQRLIDMGASGIGLGTFSDWQHVTRALAADGLELYMKGKTVRIRKSAQTNYPHTFQPDDGVVIDFKPTINHVSGPGQGGQSKNPVPAGNKGTEASAQGSRKTETDAEKADAVTHRSPPQGPDAKHTGAHTESTGNNSGPAYARRKRKDEATLTCRALPDLGLQHTANLSGWGGKFDGVWHLVTVKHAIAGRSPATTSLSMTREPSGASQKSIGIALPAGSK